MAQKLIRIAAGLGIAVTFTVSSGLGAAVASADPGGPRSPSSHSRDGGHSRGDGDRQSRRGSRDGDRGEHRRHDPRQAGGPGTVDRRGGVDRSPTVVAGRGVSSPSVVEPTVTSRVAAVQPAASDPVPEVASRPTGSSGSRSSVSERGRDALGLVPGASDVTGLVQGARGAMGPLSRPRVTFGDGRSPGYPAVRPDGPARTVSADPTIGLPGPAARATAPPVSGPPAPAPAPLPAPSPAPAIAQPVEWSPETPVTSLWGRVQPNWPAGLIFGIAGLLLAPLGGIWLGHRQARASRTASELVSH